jgi:hypothetical protein
MHKCLEQQILTGTSAGGIYDKRRMLSFLNLNLNLLLVILIHLPSHPRPVLLTPLHSIMSRHLRPKLLLTNWLSQVNVIP